jgi:hypothetical protein
MQVELDDDATHPMTGMNTISFKMPSSDVLHLNDVLFVLSLTKNLLFVLAITDYVNKGYDH